jgi:hypothetical protein
MSDSEFWAVIDDVATHSEAARLAILEEQMRAWPSARLVVFDWWRCDLMNRAHTALLWAAARIMCGGCSDDGFDYFKGWLILQGSQTYQAAVADPDSLAGVQIDYPSCEQFLTLSARILRKRGECPLQSVPPRPSVASLSVEEAQSRLPKLWARYGDNPL